jgi:hypothetical protein
MDVTTERIPIWNSPVQAWCLPYVQHAWLWVCCVSPFCNHARAVPIAPWRIRWGERDTLAAMRGRFRCGVCGRQGCEFRNPTTDANGIAPFPVGREMWMSGPKNTFESWEVSPMCAAAWGNALKSSD